VASTPDDLIQPLAEDDSNMKKQHFSLVELMLALGVVAIGVCSIMVLFPIGANASRDASMETFAAQAADQMLNFRKYKLYNTWDLGNIPSGAPSSIGNTGGLDFCTNTDNWEPGTIPQLYSYKSSPSSGLYQLISYKDGAESPLTDCDYRVILKLYYDTIKVGSNTYSTDFAVRLNVEASWPAELPDAQRQKALYTMDVFSLH
jgi:type II secretory pathway pseudopilin PulG